MATQTQKRNKNRRRFAVTVLLIAGIAATAWFTWTSYGFYQSRQQTRQEILSDHRKGAEVLQSPGTASGQDILEWEGKQYRRNTAVKAILCIGVDSKGEMERQQTSGTAGQADGVFLVAQDMSRDTVKILMIPRDTMTEITLFDLRGNELGKDIQHLTLAFAYGDGREKSCELMEEAVSNLLCGLSIDGYLAMNIQAIPALNDAVGGVAVPITDEGMQRQDPQLIPGTTVKLQGKQAEIYVRYRDITVPQSALARMERQKLYMQAYMETVKAAAQKDSGLIPRLMGEIQQDMVTDMAKDQYLDMGLAVLNSQQQVGGSDFITLPGKGVETAQYDEYHADREALKKVVIDLFYKEQ